ncbi:hypothetical protein NSQ89_13020 [Niallia sp. FSL R7-0648]|uniref:hypothetical protein n=1 Tax=Niallia sp. FSL R7-0648 TaxID=2954521 RepID=UPI0030F50730
MVTKKNRTSPHNYKPDGRARSDRRITVLEDCNFEFYESDLKEISKQFNDFRDIEPIAKWMKRDPDEIMLAVIHLAKSKKLKQVNRRKGK